jgi:hypothetical protein
MINKLTDKQFVDIKKFCEINIPGIDETVYEAVRKYCNYFDLIYDNDELVGCLCGSTKQEIEPETFDQNIKNITGDKYVATIDLLAVKNKGLGLGKKLVQKFQNIINDTILILGTMDKYNYKFYETIGYHKLGTWKNGSMSFVFCSNTKKFDKLKAYIFNYG